MKRYINARSAAGRVVGPLTLEGTKVVSCNKAYSGLVVVPDGVTSIGDEAFYYCTSLTSVTIPDSVKSIGDLAFFRCSSLTNVMIPDSVTNIGEWVFLECTSLKSVTLPDSLKNIKERAFQECKSLKRVTIPDSVTSIGESAFYLCDSLTSVTIGDSVTSIGRGAFRGCTSLTSVTIPGSVKSIGDYAFKDCTSLTNVTIPDSVKSIGDEAFGECPVESQLNLPQQLDDFDEDHEIRWEDIQRSISESCEYGDDPIYEQTDAGLKIEELLYDAADQVGVELEASVQGGQGSIAIIRNHGDQFSSVSVDFEDFEQNVLNRALVASSPEQFISSCCEFLTSLID